MSTLRGIRTTIAVAAAASVLLLAGCSSSGSIGKSSAAGDKSGGGPAAVGSKSPSGDSSSSGSSDSSAPSSDSSSSSDSSGSSGGSDNAGGDDPGCAAAMDAMSGAMKNLNPSDPAGAKKMLQDIAAKMHDAAGKSKKPDAASAINKVADDYANLANSLGGGVPNMSGLQTDAQAMGTACA
jgi:hypothetical protein